MRARVDPTRCQGYGICVEVAPDHFETDDWGFVQARPVEVDADSTEVMHRAVAQCPIRAIRWVDGPSTGSSSGPPSDSGS